MERLASGADGQEITRRAVPLLSLAQAAIPRPVPGAADSSGTDSGAIGMKEGGAMPGRFRQPARATWSEEQPLERAGTLPCRHA